VKQVRVCRWKLLGDTVPGKVITTRHEMTEEEAKARDPDAKQASPWVERTIYEPGDEIPANSRPSN
jgi:hypothetical protein